MGQIDALADMVGDPNSYDALVGSGERFMRENPDILSGRLTDGHAVGLWAGIVVGASAMKEHLSPRQ